MFRDVGPLFLPSLVATGRWLAEWLDLQGYRGVANHLAKLASPFNDTAPLGRQTEMIDMSKSASSFFFGAGRRQPSEDEDLTALGVPLDAVVKAGSGGGWTWVKGVCAGVGALVATGSSDNCWPITALSLEGLSSGGLEHFLGDGRISLLLVVTQRGTCKEPFVSLKRAGGARGRMTRAFGDGLFLLG